MKQIKRARACVRNTCARYSNERTHTRPKRSHAVHAYFKDFSLRVTITAAPRNRSPEIGAPYLNAQDVVTGVFSGCPRRQSLQSVLSFRGCHILLNSPACFSGMPGSTEDACFRLTCHCIAIVRLPLCVKLSMVNDVLGVLDCVDTMCITHTLVLALST